MMQYLVAFPRTRVRGPIKATATLCAVASSTAFPRTRVRGPIEAGGTYVVRGSGLLFPRTRVRGPIEARLNNHLNECQFREFPRTRVRGPIEAPSPKEEPTMRASFRGRESAAPLKR